MCRPPQMAYHHMRRSAVFAGRFDSRNRLESGEIRVNMQTRWFAFVPPCGGSRPFQFRESEELFFGKQPTVAGLERIGGLIMEKR